MNRFDFIFKCLCLLMLVFPTSAFADCCCVSGACDEQVRVEDASAGETSQPPCACCAIEVEQPSCCSDFANDCRDCDCCELSVPAETFGILVSQIHPEEADAWLPSIETMPVHGGATFDSTFCATDSIPIGHQQRQAMLSVWRN